MRVIVACVALVGLAAAVEVAVAAADASVTPAGKLPWLNGGFTESAMARLAGLREQILSLPFLNELTAGTLPEEKFAFYLVQDSHYLRHYSKVLAMLAAKAPFPNITQTMSRAADMALFVEGALHEVFLSNLSPSLAGIRETGPSPTCSAYTDMLTSRAHAAPYEVAFAAALPCYTVYCEVGRHIVGLDLELEQHPYAKWIQTYGGTDFEDATARAVAHLDRLAATASEGVRAQMYDAFDQAARMEWMFWDSAYNLQQWPVQLPAAVGS